MRRRALLVTLASGVLAGCAGTNDRTVTTDATTPGVPDDDGAVTTTDPAPSTTETASTPTPPEPDARSQFLELDVAPVTWCLSTTSEHPSGSGTFVASFASTATADSPAAVRVWVTNDTEYERPVDLSRFPAFGRQRSRAPHELGRPRERLEADGARRRYLVPTENHPSVADPPGVERGDDGRWNATRLDHWEPGVRRLAPGESAFGEYHVVGSPDRTTSFPRRGVYRFRGRETVLRLVAWETGRPGRVRSSRFEGRSVPPMPDDATPVWYHEADATTPVLVVPDVERGRLPVQVRFVAANRSRERAQCGHWNLFKLVDGDWFHVAPLYHTADCRAIGPGSAKRYVLNAYHGEALPDPEYAGPGRSVGWLGAGTYAVVAGYGPDGGDGAALVELDGARRTVVPTDDATATVDGDVVRVRTEPPDADFERTRRVTAVLERVDAAPDGTRYLPEQVMRRYYRALRNTLAFADDASRVVLETTDRWPERVTGFDATAARFRFEGDAYEFTRRDGETG
ncbi:hypothetical protein [Halorubellus sp. PRR65]|uniref:hypothetical protein n=1 Tax=Halorubellus sp. PRR65 TaxID=3098148 RepID=UPI002B25E6BC|nr:hypothetical protein [Halorubellus sp. PRR65]